MSSDPTPPDLGQFITFEHIWGVVVTLLVSFMGWRHTERRKEIDGMKAEIAANRRALDEHKLHAAETFATADDVARSLNEAEGRLREQIKQNHEHMMQRLDDIKDRLPRRN